MCVFFPEMEGVCVWSAQWTGMELMAELKPRELGTGKSVKEETGQPFHSVSHEVPHIV